MSGKVKYIPAPEVAKILGLSPQTLANQRFQGVGLPYHKFGRAIRYLLADVLDFAESRRIEPREGQGQ